MIALCALLVTITAVILQYLTSVLRRRIIYGIPVSARLVDPTVVRPDVQMRPNLHISYRDEELADPHVLEIDLTYRGRKDIRSTSFEQGQPFCIDVGIPIIELLKAIYTPEQAPLPKVEAVETALQVGPSLMRKRQVMTFVILTDGPSARLTHESPLADVRVRQARYQARQDADEARYRARQRLLHYITWFLVLFIAYYLATQPVGAANALHSAGNWLSTFVNSL